MDAARRVSEVVRVRQGFDLRQACKGIANDVSLVLMNLEWLEQRLDEEGREALQDVRSCVARIVEASKEIEHAVEGSTAPLPKIKAPKAVSEK